VRYRSELDNIATPAGVFARRAGIFRIATPFQRREFFRWPADQACRFVAIGSTIRTPSRTSRVAIRSPSKRRLI